MTSLAKAVTPIKALKTELRYLAGLFDGEGTICITTTRSRKKTWSPKYQLRVAVRMVASGPVRDYHVAFGGSLCLSNSCIAPSAKRAHWRQCTVWSCAELKALAALQALRPYLRTKEEHIKTAIAFMETKRVFYGSRGVPPEILAKREQLRDQLSALNSSKWRQPDGTRRTASTPRCTRWPSVG